MALISDTGMRLSEAAGLAREDIVLDADIPHVIIRPHPWRRLKTKGSEEDTAASRMLSMGRQEGCRGFKALPLPLSSLLQQQRLRSQLSQCCTEQVA